MDFLRLCRVAALLSTTWFCVACGSEPLQRADSSVWLEEEKSELDNGAALVEGMLLFLNHKSTTVALLDATVDLDVRVAEGIVDHRNGSDEILGTSDDNHFESIDELDSIEFVGPKTLELIKEYTIANGWVLRVDEFLGVYDGVSFTVLEAEAVLGLVNRASLKELDSLIDSRAAVTIIEDRPIFSILELSAVKWIGPQGLSQLKLASNDS